MTPEETIPMSQHLEALKLMQEANTIALLNELIDGVETIQNTFKPTMFAISEVTKLAEENGYQSAVEKMINLLKSHLPDNKEI